MSFRPVGTLILMTALCAAAPANAVIMDTVYGTDLVFTYDKDTPFGEATVIGNNIFFTPTDFKAESLDGEGPVTNNVTLNVDVSVRTDAGYTPVGYEMDFFQLYEEGDYELNGSGASVKVNGQFRVTSLTTNAPPLGFFPFMDEEIFDAGALTVEGALTTWNVGTSIDLADTSGWTSDTSVRLTIENKLTATTLNSGVGETAFVEKKFSGSGIGIIINPVPIPAAVWLFGSALGLLGWMRRRA